jgi:uncharacterized protein YegL
MASVLPRGEEKRPRTAEELILLLLDGSGSMSGKESQTGRVKAESVIYHLVRQQQGDSRDTGSLLQRLKASSNRDRFWLSVITFDNRIDVALHPRRLEQVVPEDLDIDLLGKHGDLTAIGHALTTAHQIAQSWLDDADPLIPRFATILLMSDGQETVGSDPVGVAQTIKKNTSNELGRPQIAIATAAYGDDADGATLSAIASQRADGSPMFARVDTGAQLRDFFMESISSTALAVTA